MEDTCRVTFSDGDNDVLQVVELESIPDLLDLLRWPLIHAGPMYTDAGKYVTWNTFEDIDYSDLAFLRPYITFRATRTAPEELPSRLSQFFDITDEITIRIEHDESACPIALEEDVDHGVCWRIFLPTEAPEKLKHQLRELKSGREVHGLLASGRIWIRALYELVIAFEHKVGSPDCLVFQEDKWVRRLLRGKGINLPKVSPGSYLRSKEEKWYLEISYNKGQVLWRAISTLTGHYLNRYVQSFALDFTNSLEKERERILNLITHNIGTHLQKISNLVDVEEYVVEHLEDLGFGDEKPPVEMKIEHSDLKYSIILMVEGGSDDWEIAKGSYNIDEKATEEEITSGFIYECDDGWVSQYNVVNEDKASIEFNEVLEKYDFSEPIQDDESGTDELYLRLHVEDDFLLWQICDEQGDEVDRGILIDSFDWLINEPIEEVRSFIKGDMKGRYKNIANLEEVLEDELEDIIDEISDG